MSGARQGRLTVARLAALWVLAGASLALAAPRVASAASSPPQTRIVFYGCHESDVCSVDPAGGVPTHLRSLPESLDFFIGATTNGTTIGYESMAGTMHLAPSAGSSAGGIFFPLSTPGPVPAEQLSPSGSAVLANDAAQNAFAPNIIMEYFDTPPPNGTAVQIDSGPHAEGVIAGWYGDTPLTAHSVQNGDGTSTSWICVAPANGACPQDSSQVRIRLPAGAYPQDVSGSPATKLIAVSVSTTASRQDSSIELFDATTGAYLRTVATPPPGFKYEQPTFSPDGRQVAYVVLSNTNAIAPDAINVVNVDGSDAHGALLTVQDATDLSWTDVPASQQSPAPPPPAPVVVISAPRQSLGAVRRHRQLRARCAIRGAGTCRITASVTAATARQLGLLAHHHSHAARARARDHHAPRYTLTHAVHRFARQGRRTLALRLSPREVRALGRLHRLTVRLTGASTRRHHRTRRATRTITLR